MPTIYCCELTKWNMKSAPTDGKHPAVLPVGHEAEFKIKNNRMFLAIPDGGDHKTRSYEVVAMRPTNSDNDAQNSSGKSADKP